MDKKIGIMLSEIPFSNMPVIFKSAGCDFMIVDTEHGGFDESDLSKIIMTASLCGIGCVVRIPDNSRRNIIRLLDMGADGLLLPMTDSKEDILKVVRFAKYSPVGKRGISTMRAHTKYNPGDLAEYMSYANRKVKVYAQIETLSGLKNCSEIVNANGVDGVFVGPNDLSCDIGCLFDGDKKPILEAISKIGSEVKGKDAGIITSDKDYLAAAEKAGYTHYCIGSELHILKSGAQATVKNNK